MPVVVKPKRRVLQSIGHEQDGDAEHQVVACRLRHSILVECHVGRLALHEDPRGAVRGERHNVGTARHAVERQLMLHRHASQRVAKDGIQVVNDMLAHPLFRLQHHPLLSGKAQDLHLAFVGLSCLKRRNGPLQRRHWGIHATNLLLKAVPSWTCRIAKSYATSLRKSSLRFTYCTARSPSSSRKSCRPCWTRWWTRDSRISMKPCFTVATRMWMKFSRRPVAFP